MRQQICATVCNTERYVSINLYLQSSLVSSWGWDVPASIVYLKCIPSLLLCSWFAFWLLADLLVILQGKRISAAQSVMWKKKKFYLLPRFSLHSVCFLQFWKWYDVVQVTLAGCEKVFKRVALVFWQNKFYLLSPWFQQTYGHRSMWVLSNCCARYFYFLKVLHMVVLFFLFFIYLKKDFSALQTQRSVCVQ